MIKLFYNAAWLIKSLHFVGKIFYILYSFPEMCLFCAMLCSSGEGYSLGLDPTGAEVEGLSEVECLQPFSF